jgi:hypothetical protein
VPAGVRLVERRRIEALVIEDIEQIGHHPQTSPQKGREILPQPQVR